MKLRSRSKHFGVQSFGRTSKVSVGKAIYDNGDDAHHFRVCRSGLYKLFPLCKDQCIKNVNM